MRFTYGAYLDLLDELSGRYSLHPLREFTSEPRRLYLRHDIDVCPKRALRMAEQEARRSYRSTYMFIPTCPLYELSSDVLRPFVDLGHEVALHFDYRTSGIDPDDIEPAVRDQCDKLSRFTGEPVRSISFHRDAHGLLPLRQRRPLAPGPARHGRADCAAAYTPNVVGRSSRGTVRQALRLLPGSGGGRGTARHVGRGGSARMGLIARFIL